MLECIQAANQDTPVRAIIDNYGASSVSIEQCHLVFINTRSRSVSYEREYEDDGELQGWWWVEVA